MAPSVAVNASLFDELSEHMASGVVIYAGTRDASFAPEATFAIGARSERGRGVVTVYLPSALAGATRKNIEENGEVAVTMTRPSDHKSIQIKGKALAVRLATEVERELLAVRRAALVEQFAGIGIPRELSRRMLWWPSLAVEMEVREVYAQTPGPRAGERMPGV